MNKKSKVSSSLLLGLTLAITGCNTNASDNQSAQKHEQIDKENKQENKITTGQELTKILSSTNWQGTKVYDKNNKDLTKENANFIGLAKYDGEASRYEFFDKNTKKSRGDKGTFFITNGKIRVLISESFGYQAVVEITELNKDLFTYKRMGKDANGNDVEVFVEHIPYTGTELSFTDQDKILETYTGDVVTDVDGDKVLSSTPWQGTVALDEKGNDVSSYNADYLGLAKYDDITNKYEFFDAKTGESRGDYGYYDVVHGNKIRALVSQGENKYGAVLELTELNENKFTYKRIGKDKDGKEIPIIVEHIPYEGDVKLKLTK
ncbi:DUF4822 domain-containing protein [Bacillus sp. SD075]|uniref:DUF4822 domain-containing protein n=1 Tax=Bacillus sp. SD075 TaxID=2781732 RepID=UPI001A97948B|nr:DUF4822 domain-containing protein [Bacillus sp. SD075]MBO0999770.1 DUF4822 domain-containing protein [Bacillus sp. SD075]